MQYSPLVKILFLENERIFLPSHQILCEGCTDPRRAQNLVAVSENEECGRKTAQIQIEVGRSHHVALCCSHLLVN